ncbi:hypothetical protein CDL12_22294 [Handroanthus impetiginosus]|uniref:F-box domain-containing protein n=1 Tax=Handroanthus impetiginosus TaxID=429701 RepID=A0A2G9GIT7_9LAMI|nr:hypothetical protein CDL12_22294 [Handroanthus impetiginosus]
MEIESCGGVCELSEDCIANVLSLTSPKDTCRLSTVSSVFRSASQSDTVWDRFLPSDYREIISSAVGEPDSLLGQFHSKKDLFLYLCDHPILIDDGRKSFSLEKSSGKKCHMLAARELSIVWGDTPEYWQWIHLPESRFSEVAELIDVCWLEISGKINTHMLSSRANYAAYLVFTWNTETYRYGFRSHPANGSVSIGGHESQKCSFYLVSEEEQREMYQITERQQQDNGEQRQQQDNAERGIQYPKLRDDRWMEVELGECFVRGGQDGDLGASLTMLTGNWKSGIIIQGIEIRPKECK